jgi:hypothetical protein
VGTVSPLCRGEEQQADIEMAMTMASVAFNLAAQRIGAQLTGAATFRNVT